MSIIKANLNDLMSLWCGNNEKLNKTLIRIWKNSLNHNKSGSHGIWVSNPKRYFKDMHMHKEKISNQQAYVHNDKDIHVFSYD